MPPVCEQKWEAVLAWVVTTQTHRVPQQNISLSWLWKSLQFWVVVCFGISERFMCLIASCRVPILSIPQWPSLGITLDLLRKLLFAWGMTWWTVALGTHTHPQCQLGSRLCRQLGKMMRACSSRLDCQRWLPIWGWGQVWTCQSTGGKPSHVLMDFRIFLEPRKVWLAAESNLGIECWKLLDFSVPMIEYIDFLRSKVGISHSLPVKSRILPIKSHILPIHLPYFSKSWKSKTRKKTIKIP